MEIKFSNIAILLLLAALSYVNPGLAQGGTDRPTFFRDGQQSLEEEIQNLERQESSSEAEQPRVPLTIDDKELQWQKFIFRDGGFSVWMPEGTPSEETLRLETATGEMTFEVFATRPKTYRFLAAYSDKMNPSQVQNPEMLLASVRDSIVTKVNLKLISDRAISWEQHLGRQFSVQGEDETIIYRVYSIGQRVYLLAMEQQNAREVSQEAINFFDSFRLLE